MKRFTGNVVAYNLFMKGWYFFDRMNLSMIGTAVEHFNQALKLDPNYALAYWGLGSADLCFSYFGLKRTREVKPNVEKCIQKMFEVDENFSKAYTLLGFFKAFFECKYMEARSAWKRAVELDPNDIDALQNYSIHLVLWGQFDMARKLSQRAKSIDPLSDYTELSCAFPDFYAAKYDRVLERLSCYLELNPPFLWGLWFLWRTLSLVNWRSEAVEACKKAFWAAGANDIVQAMDKAGTDHAFETAARILVEVYQQHYSSPYDIATLFIHAGKKEEAIHWLETAVEEIDPKLIHFNADPDWQPIRDDERFIKLLKTTGYRT